MPETFATEADLVAQANRWREQYNPLVSLDLAKAVILRNAFLRGDMAAREAFYTSLLDRGVFCADDVLEYEDLNPQPNGQPAGAPPAPSSKHLLDLAPLPNTPDVLSVAELARP